MVKTPISRTPAAKRRRARALPASRVRRRLVFGESSPALLAGVIVIRSNEELVITGGAPTGRVTMFSLRVRYHRYFGAMRPGTRVVVVGSGKRCSGRLMCVGVLRSTPYRTKVRPAGGSPYRSEHSRKQAFAFEINILSAQEQEQPSLKVALPEAWHQVRYLQTPALVRNAALEKLGEGGVYRLLEL